MRFFFILLFLQPFFHQGLLAQDSLEFDAVEVQADRIEPADPYRVSQIDSSVIDRQGFQDLGALLEEHSALQVRRYGPSGTASLSFRGTRSNETRMYWNGLPLSSPTLGQKDLSLVPAFFLDDVRLHHGGASAVDGTGGIGGSIHLNSTMEDRIPWQLRILGRGASFGGRTAGLDFTKNSKNLGSRTRLFYRSAENDFPYPDVSEQGAPIKKRDNARMDRMGGMQSFRYELGNGHRLFASGWYFRSSRSVPSPIDQVERGQEQEDRNVNSMLGWAWNGADTKLSFRSGYFFSDLLFTEEISDLRSEIRTNAWRNRFQGTHRLDEKRSISASWSYELEHAASSGYQESKERIQSRGFLQFQNRFGESLILQALLQEEWVDGDRVPLMPTLGLDWEFLKHPELHLKGNASRTYRVPTLNDLYWNPGGNPDLRPQEGRSYEAGLSGAFGKKSQAFQLKTEFTAFLLRMEDRIVWAPTSRGYWSPKNIDRSMDRGFEMSVESQLRFHKNWKVRVKGDYSYVDAQVIDQVNAENELKGKAIYIPPHRGSASLIIQRRNRTRLTYGITHTGQRFIDRDNLSYLPPYTLQRLHLERRIRLRSDLLLTVEAGVRNLFDIPYHSVAWHPMPGRSFELSLRLRIGP